MSNNLALTQLAESQVDKEATINDQAAELDAALTDLVTMDLTDATSPLALTNAQALRAMALKLIGTHPGAPFEIQVPTNRKSYVVWNTTGEPVTIAPSGGAGVEVEDTLALVYCDGTDVLAVASGGTGSNLSTLQAVRAVATAPGSLASDYSAGSNVDGVVLAEDDRLLLAGQSAASENGVYLVQAIGAPVRADDLNEDADLLHGLLVPVVEGSDNARTLWMLTSAGPYTLGSTDLTFERVAGNNTAAGLARLLDDTTTADGTATDFALSAEPEGTLLVFVDGLLQDEDDYGVVTTTLSFPAPPPSGAHVIAYDGAFTGATRPYDVGLFVPGTQPDGALLAEVVFTRAVDFPDDFAGSSHYARTAAAAATVLTIERNGASVGTITVAAAGQTGTFATSLGAVSVTAGDRLALLNQNPADATLADVSITLKGTRA